MILLVALWPAAFAAAQPPDSSLGSISDVNGTADLVRQDQRALVTTGQPVVDGDRLETREARVEVAFAEDAEAILHLDRETWVDLLSANVVRLRRGRLRVTLPGETLAPSRVDTPAAQILFRQPGEYQIAVRVAGDTQLSVVHGRAELRTDGGSVEVGAGEQVATRSTGGVSEPTTFNTAAWDAFDRYAERRRATRLDRYATRILDTRLRPERRLSRREPARAQPATSGRDAGIRRNVWSPTWPYWVLGPGLFGSAVIRPSELSELLERPTVEVTTVIQITPARPEEPEAERPVEPPARLSVVGLPAAPGGGGLPPRMAGGAVAGSVFVERSGTRRAQSVIVLPRGGGRTAATTVTRSRTINRRGVGTTTKSATASTRAAASQVSSRRAPSRSTRYQRISGRSARRSARQP